MWLIAAVALVQTPIQTITFANGAKMTYGGSRVRIKTIEGDADFDLGVLWNERAKNRVRGDKVLNDLAYVMGRGGAAYSVRWVRVSPSRALGVVSYYAANMSSPHFDSRSELWSVEIASKGPKLTPWRFIEPTGDFTPSGPRLFWSKGELLLRGKKGFTVLETTAGSPTDVLPLEGTASYIGRNRAGMILLNSSADRRRRLDLTIFDPASRATSNHVYQTDLLDPWITTSMTRSGNVQFDISGQVPQSPVMRIAYEVLVVNAETGKVITRSRTNQN